MEGQNGHALRDRIKAADDLSKELVEVPEWGVTVQVRALAVGERLRLMKEWRDDDAEGGVNIERFYPTLLLATVFDPDNGAPVFEPADMEWMNSKSSAPTERLALVAIRLSGLAPEGADEAGEGS